MWTYLSGCVAQNLEAWQIFVRRGVSKFNEPCRKPKLLRNASNRAGVRAELEGVDETVH